MTAKKFFHLRLAPFRYPHFRALFASQGISLIGSWMQELAKSWIVLNMMGSASSMGALLFAAAIPNVLFAGLGGTLADSKNAKKILVLTQVALAVLAFALGILVSGGHVKFYHLVVFAVLEGTIVAFDIPAFNTVTPQLVPKEDFQQALALNTVNFHMSRVLGPSLAGLVMALGGPASVFWINAVSFMGVVWVISRLPLKASAKPRASSKGALGEVWKYLWTHPQLSRVILQFVILMSLVFPLVFTTLRIHVKELYNLNARDFGLVFSVPGIGALTGSLSFLFLSPKNPLKVLPWGVIGIVLFLVGIAESQSLPLTIAFLLLFSISLFLSLSSLLVTVQLTVDNEIRGRVSALVGLAFVSLAPVMSVPIGFVSDHLGPRNLLLGIAGLFGVIMYTLKVRATKKISIPGGGPFPTAPH